MTPQGGGKTGFQKPKTLDAAAAAKAATKAAKQEKNNLITKLNGNIFPA